MKIGEAKCDVEDWRLEMEIGDLTGPAKYNAGDLEIGDGDRR